MQSDDAQYPVCSGGQSSDFFGGEDCDTEGDGLLWLLLGMPTVLEFRVGLPLDVELVGVGAGIGTALPLEYPMGAARLSGLTLVQSTFSGSGGA